MVQRLEKKITEYIKSQYKAEYIGFLEVEKLNPGYKFKIGIPSYMTPTTIATDIEDEELFLNMVYEELRTKNYVRNFYYKINRTTNAKEE